ncbi:MAG TPA: helix-turn-helix domain-containing protein [Actinocrinis sp.]|nr:helix-turn-helix domain-containing protein [Actinocrinis sp.]
MPRESGLRDRKKLQTRRRLADAAALLFAEKGYDAVTMTEVARAAEVSEQTVYNYFPAKQDLVLDLAETIRERYGRVTRDREQGISPARALEPLIREDIERYRTTQLHEARGEFPAQCLESAVLRRFALEERERQTRTICDAIIATDPDIPTVVAYSHAAALVAVIQVIIDDIGACVLARSAQDTAAATMQATVQDAFDHLDRVFAALATDD